MRSQRSLVLEVLDKEDVADQFQSAAVVPTQQLDKDTCNQTNTPECLRALYKIGDTTADPSSKAILGVAGFLEVGSLKDQLGFHSPQAK